MKEPKNTKKTYQKAIDKNILIHYYDSDLFLGVLYKSDLYLRFIQFSNVFRGL